MKAIDLVTPPIATSYFMTNRELYAIRNLLEVVTHERDNLESENARYRRMIFALLAAAGGKVEITDKMLVELNFDDRIMTTHDARTNTTEVRLEKK